MAPTRWVKLNKLKDGEFDEILDFEFENYENILYDSYNNAIYDSYDLHFAPRKSSNNRLIASVDAILDFLLLTLEDREFRMKKGLG